MSDINFTTPAVTQAVAALSAALAVAMQEGLDQSICGTLAEACAEAQQIIAEIPAKVMQLVANVVQNADRISAIAKREYTCTLLTCKGVTFPQGQSFSVLKRSHRIVFDYCKKAGLEPSLWELGRWYGDGYELQIHIRISEAQIQEALQKFKSANSCSQID